METIILIVVIAVVLLGAAAGLVVNGRRHKQLPPPPPPDTTLGAPTRPAPVESRPSAEPEAEPQVEAEPEAVEEPAAVPALDIPEPTAGRLVRLRSRLSRSQGSMGQGLLSLLSRDRLDEDTWEEIEEVLLTAVRPELDRTLRTAPHDGRPAVVLVVGVNGTGKTTTCARCSARSC